MTQQKLDREEHLKVHTRSRQHRWTHSQSVSPIQVAFEHFDLDGDGQITRGELKQSLTKMGMSDEGIEDIIDEVDKDGSGTIDYNEFCTM